jgi:hypothetical protein
MVTTSVVGFDQLLTKANYATFFYIAFALSLGLAFYSVYRDIQGTKSIYTLMTTPTPKPIFYLSKFTASLLGSFTVIAFQIINIFISYNMYLFAVTNNRQMQNGLFLSFLRYDFFRSLIPYRPMLMISSLLSVVLTVNIILFIAYSIRARIYAALVLVPSIIFICLCVSLPLRIPLFLLPMNDALQSGFGYIVPSVLLVLFNSLLMVFNIWAAKKAITA